MSNINLRTTADILSDGYKKLEKGTFLESSEILNQERIHKLGLINELTHTANLVLARLASDGSKEIEFGISGRRGFDVIAGDNIDSFCDEVLKRKDSFYELTPEQISFLPDLENDITWAKSSDLDLYYFKKGSFFTIYTNDLLARTLNEKQRLFAEKVYGSFTNKQDPKQDISDYGENLCMILKKDIPRINILLPYLKTNIIKNIDSKTVFARPSILGGFNDISSNFFTYDFSNSFFVGFLHGYNSLPTQETKK